jgi:hypothetical protein
MTSISTDSALLPVADGILYNNTFGRGDITSGIQRVFDDDDTCGWEWNWPTNTGPGIKAYPEIIIGSSPWCSTKHTLLPRRLGEINYLLDFAIKTQAEGQWCESLDFWITDSPTPRVENIVSNLCIWLKVHNLPANYIGKDETLEIGGRTYTAIFETPADHPPKTWTTLFAMENEFRSDGTLDLRPFIQVMTERGLVHPDLYLATAEMGSEVAGGWGKSVVRIFGLL